MSEDPDEVLRRYISNPGVRARVEAAVGEKIARAIERESRSDFETRRRTYIKGARIARQVTASDAVDDGSLDNRPEPEPGDDNHDWEGEG